MAHGALLVLLSLLAPQAEGDPVARWTFDGDLKDSGKSAHPSKAVGRIEFIDSPVAGKMAVFNGVDAFVQVDPAGKLGAGSADFTLSAWIFAFEKRPSTLFARKGWSLQLLDGGVLKFTGGGELTSPGGSCPPAQWAHVAVSVKRGGESFLFVNGQAVANGAIPEGDLDAPGAPLFVGCGVVEGKPFAGMMDDVRLYARALDAAEIAKKTDEGIPWIRAKAHAKTPFAGKFELMQDDVVVFAGGENARVGQDLGYLETLLSVHAAGKRVHCRNMAWEADTVYEQPRPLNFGSWSDQFRRSGATVVFAQFGQVESLEGKAGVERFTTAYQALLDQYAQTTKRIVLVSPTPFAKGSARAPDLAAKNEDLKLYVDAIRKLAAKNGCLFIDLATKPLTEEGMTRNGMHLSLDGHWVAARETARQLEIAGVSDLDAPDPRGAFRRESLEKIRLSIQYKNLLWTEHWRPTNWAFLNGDRMEQPSSRDHQDRRVRWFPVEIQMLPAMIRREEEKIETLVGEKK